MIERQRPWECLGDITDEIEFEMHECFPLRRAPWFGNSNFVWGRKDTEVAIRAQFESMPARAQFALLE